MEEQAERPSEAWPGPGPHHAATDVQEGAVGGKQPTNCQFAAWRPRAAGGFRNRAARFGPPAEGRRCFATAVCQSGAHS
jgi:hypothetical protein